MFIQVIAFHKSATRKISTFPFVPCVIALLFPQEHHYFMEQCPLLAAGKTIPFIYFVNKS